MSCRVSTVRERRKGQEEKASVREGKYDMKTTEMGEMLSLPGPIPCSVDSAEFPYITLKTH